jgi:hypothetical protein
MYVFLKIVFLSGLKGLIALAFSVVYSRSEVHLIEMIMTLMHDKRHSLSCTKGTSMLDMKISIGNAIKTHSLTDS